MKKFLVIIGISSLLIACGTSLQTTNKKNMTEYYSKEPNLKNVTYSGGDGSSFEKAIIINNARNSRNGIASEYSYISKKYGRRGVDWKFISQSLVEKKGKMYDVLKIQNSEDDEILIFNFDITEFFGKF